MSKSSGFLQLRRGIWEHVHDCRMSITQALAFIYICSEADTRTGIWKGSAKSLSGELGISDRTARDILEKMERSGYIKRFAIPGLHACYPILVHKFLITDGEHNGEQLDALNSTSASSLKYLPSKIREHDGGHGVEHGAAQKRIENREKRKEKKNPAAKPTPPSDSRHKLAFDSCYEAYREKFGAAPTWAGREAKTLQRFLQDHASIAVEEITRRYGHLLSSTERFHAEKHGSLVHLLANFDAFADGPIHKIPLSNGGLTRGKTKPTVGDAMQITLDAYRQLEAGKTN